MPTPRKRTDSHPASQTAAAVQAALQKLARADKAAFLPRFFKTGKGEYGEGDVFLGVMVPDQRAVARQFRDLPPAEIVALLRSAVHEHRLTALLIWVDQYTRLKKAGDEPGREKIVRQYLRCVSRINNWDLVDLSAPNILGDWLLDHEAGRREKLARSENLWERRMAILSTLASIRAGDLAATFAIAEMLLADTHDLLRKAVGWMLREAGKKDLAALRTFLTKHAAAMPRTMLRYAIERMAEKERKGWLTGSATKKMGLGK